jgi:hypothetical protein
MKNSHCDAKSSLSSDSSGVTVIAVHIQEAFGGWIKARAATLSWQTRSEAERQLSGAAFPKRERIWSR